MATHHGERVTRSSWASAGATTRSPPSSTPWSTTPGAARALADSGLAKSEIDGYMCAGTGFGPTSTMPPTWPSTCGSTTAGSTGPWSGARTFEFYVQHAAAAIEAGMCDVVLVTYGSDHAVPDGADARHQHLAGAGRPGWAGRRSSSARGATCWPAPTPWPPAGTCTSSGRRLSSWRRSPSASASSPR